MKKVKIMGIQIGWTKDKEDNLKRALAFIDEGMKQYPQTDLICLPEFFYAAAGEMNRDTVGETLDGRFAQTFAACAEKYGVNILTGTFPEARDGKLYNTCLALNREGKRIARYSKVHLFDAFSQKESEFYAAGDELGIADFDFGRVGIAVCYDLRFPEYLRTIALQNVDFLCIPAAFYRPRTEHWDILTKAAALDNSLYVMAVNQYSKHCVGRSCIVDPNGVVINRASDGEGIIFGTVDPEYQKEVRDSLALFENRRPELYE